MNGIGIRAGGGIVLVAVSFAGGLAWARRKRRADRIVREALTDVLAADDDAVDVVVRDAVGRLTVRPGTDRGAVATVLGLGRLAHRRTESAPVQYEPAGALVEQATDAILVLDDANRIRFATASARAMFGTAMLDGRDFLDFVDGAERRMAGFLLDKVRHPDAGRPGFARGDLTMASADGRTSRDEILCRDLRSDASIGGLVITLRDVTGQRRLEHELTRSVFQDPLTDLPNQASFRDALNRVVVANAGTAAVVLVDLDRFRIVNEGLGRATGDRVLRAVARRLETIAGEGNLAARLGGDEFAIIIERVDSVDAIDELAARVQACFAQPLPAGEDLVSCSASIGVATTAEANTDHELLRHADLALASAKAAGPGGWRRYESSMVEAVRYRTELRSALGRALHDGSLIVEYQPIVSLRTWRTAGFEALVRWRHPTRGLLSPAEFIDIAEDSELIHAVGGHVLTSAIGTASRWPRTRDQDPPYVSVNVSARQFRVDGFADTVRAMLERGGLAPRRLVLEITESLLLRDDDRVWEQLSRLRGWGVGIAIDDFGTGYSALGYLRQVPLDIVKLDRVFISTMATSTRQRALVAGIVGLVNALGLAAVAEGIETPEQRDICAEIGCGYGQGYLFARSMSAPDAAAWLRRSATA